MANKNYRQHRLLIDGKEYVDVETIAPLLGRCEEQVRRMARNNVIPSITEGRRFWFHLQDVQQIRKLKTSVSVRQELLELGF